MEQRQTAEHSRGERGFGRRGRGDGSGNKGRGRGDGSFRGGDRGRGREGFFRGDRSRGRGGYEQDETSTFAPGATPLGTQSSDRPTNRGRGQWRGWGQPNVPSEPLVVGTLETILPGPQSPTSSIVTERTDPTIDSSVDQSRGGGRGGKGRRRKTNPARSDQSGSRETTSGQQVVPEVKDMDAASLNRDTADIVGAESNPRSDPSPSLQPQSPAASVTPEKISQTAEQPAETAIEDTSAKKGRRRKKKQTDDQAQEQFQSTHTRDGQLTVIETLGTSRSGERFALVPDRPDKGGTEGSQVTVSVNCWDIDLKPMKVYMYFLEATSVARIDSTGSKKDLRMRAAELRGMLRHVVAKMPANSVYDGAHAVYTVSPLPDLLAKEETRELKIPDPLDGGSLWLKYRLLSVQTIDTADLLLYLSNPKATSLRMPQDSIRCLDCVFKCALGDEFENLGRHALFSKSPVAEKQLLSIYRGFLTSVRPQWKIRANIDMVHKAFLRAGNMADVLYDKYGDRMADCVRQMQQDVMKIRVETNERYKQKTGRVKRLTVHGLSLKPATELIIKDLNQTVAAYFEEKYGLKLTYPDLPCVKSKADREEYFPMELLNIRPSQQPKASKADVASEVIRVAAVRPGDRFREIERFLGIMLQRGKPLLNKFGINLNNTLTSVKGRLLPTPKAKFGQQTTQLDRGKWMVKSFETIGCQDKVIKWALFSIPVSRFGNEKRDIVARQLPMEASKFGIQMQLVKQESLPIGELELRVKNLNVDLVVLVLHDDMSYARIKRLSDLHLGVRTQCVRDRTLTKPRVMSNLLLKINGKLGGVNWTIPELHHPTERFMVFGADVTHPSPTQSHDIQMSIAAVTASISPDLMRYAAVVRQQRTRKLKEKAVEETINEMREFITELLKCYHRHNNCFPTKLMFYRDGVSEGQFECLLNTELPAIQRACHDISQDYEPGITFIVVQKRHHLRFMQANRNVDPGTVVDTDVTHRREFDFYLSSAEGIQGTLKPAHYHVLCDDANWSSDALQKFTFYLCHAYMRCSRSVSYPAPTYYAHLAAFRAREWLNGAGNEDNILRNNRFQVHESQVDGMFYL